MPTSTRRKHPNYPAARLHTTYLANLAYCTTGLSFIATLGTVLMAQDPPWFIVAFLVWVVVFSLAVTGWFSILAFGTAKSTKRRCHPRPDYRWAARKADPQPYGWMLTHLLLGLAAVSTVAVAPRWVPLTLIVLMALTQTVVDGRGDKQIRDLQAAMPDMPKRRVVVERAWRYAVEGSALGAVVKAKGVHIASIGDDGKPVVTDLGAHTNDVFLSIDPSTGAPDGDPSTLTMSPRSFSTTISLKDVDREALKIMFGADYDAPPAVDGVPTRTPAGVAVTPPSVTYEPSDDNPAAQPTALPPRTDRGSVWVAPVGTPLSSSLFVDGHITPDARGLRGMLARWRRKRAAKGLLPDGWRDVGYIADDGVTMADPECRTWNEPPAGAATNILKRSMYGTTDLTPAQLDDFHARRAAAGRFVTDARKNAAIRERAAVEARAPISDAALRDLDSL